MIRISEEKFFYADRYICLEEVFLPDAQAYENDAVWSKPYLDNAQTILYFTQGTWNVRIEGTLYHPNPGEICILRGLEACMLAPKTYPCAMYRISFSENYFRVVDPDLSMNTPFVRRTLGTGNLYVLPPAEKERFAMNLSRIKSKAVKSEKRLALFAMLLDLMQAIGELYDPEPEDQRVAQAREVLDFINAHYCEAVTIRILTQKLYMSRSQIERIMKTATGYSAWDYILHKRILCAIKLLHAGMGNREAAQKTGFRDYSTFYKAFVKLTHKTPTDEHPAKGTDPLLTNFYEPEKEIPYDEL